MCYNKFTKPSIPLRSYQGGSLVNRFDKPLGAASAILVIIASVGMIVSLVAMIATGANSNPGLFGFALLGIVGAIILFVSDGVYRKWHTHTSIVTGIWTERRPKEHKLGRSFQSLTGAYPEVAIMRLKSGGTYNLGPLDEFDPLTTQVRVGDTVIVDRAWGAANGHWHTRLLGVVQADKRQAARKPGA